MNNIDILRITIRNLLRRKTRTLLTVMGVVIGTASIVIMISIGIGMNEGFKQEISRRGVSIQLTFDHLKQGCTMAAMKKRMPGEIQEKCEIWTILQ